MTIKLFSKRLIISIRWVRRYDRKKKEPKEQEYEPTEAQLETMNNKEPEPRMYKDINHNLKPL